MYSRNLPWNPYNKIGNDLKLLILLWISVTSYFIIFIYTHPILFDTINFNFQFKGLFNFISSYSSQLVNIKLGCLT